MWMCERVWACPRMRARWYVPAACLRVSMRVSMRACIHREGPREHARVHCFDRACACTSKHAPIMCEPASVVASEEGIVARAVAFVVEVYACARARVERCIARTWLRVHTRIFICVCIATHAQASIHKRVRTRIYRHICVCARRQTQPACTNALTCTHACTMHRHARRRLHACMHAMYACTCKHVNIVTCMHACTMKQVALSHAHVNMLACMCARAFISACAYTRMQTADTRMRTLLHAYLHLHRHLCLCLHLHLHM